MRADFALKNNLGASALKTKIEASDPGKERGQPHAIRSLHFSLLTIMLQTTKASA